MLRIFLMTLFTLALLSSSAFADSEYPKGTIGYLQQSCFKALQAETLEEFNNSECLKFYAAFITGRFVVSMKNHKPYKAHDFKYNNPACSAESKAVKEKLAGDAYCKSIYEIGASSTFTALKKIVYWADWESQQNPNFKNLPIYPYFLRSEMSGGFCNHTRENNQNIFDIQASESLIELSKEPRENFGDFHGVFDIQRNEDDRQSCEKAVSEADGDLLKFLDTECAFHLSAHLAGLSGTDITNFKTYKGSEECTAQINERYNYYITAKEACLYKDLDILKFTAAMLQAQSEGKEINFCDADYSHEGQEGFYEYP